MVEKLQEHVRLQDQGPSRRRIVGVSFPNLGHDSRKEHSVEVERRIIFLHEKHARCSY